MMTAYMVWSRSIHIPLTLGLLMRVMALRCFFSCLHLLVVVMRFRRIIFFFVFSFCLLIYTFV